MKKEFMVKRLEQAEAVEQILDDFKDCFKPSPYHTKCQIQKAAEKIVSNGVCAVAERDGEIIAFIVFYANDLVSRESYVSMLAEKMEYQKTMLGAAALYPLMSYVLGYCKSQGMETIRVEVYKNNQYNISLYKKIGFSISGEASEETLYMTSVLNAVSDAIGIEPLEGRHSV